MVCRFVAVHAFASDDQLIRWGPGDRRKGRL